MGGKQEVHKKHFYSVQHLFLEIAQIRYHAASNYKILHKTSLSNKKKRKSNNHPCTLKIPFTINANIFSETKYFKKIQQVPKRNPRLHELKVYSAEISKLSRQHEDGSVDVNFYSIPEVTNLFMFSTFLVASIHFTPRRSCASQHLSQGKTSEQIDQMELNFKKARSGVLWQVFPFLVPFAASKTIFHATLT